MSKRIRSPLLTSLARSEELLGSTSLLVYGPALRRSAMPTAITAPLAIKIKVSELNPIRSANIVRDGLSGPDSCSWLPGVWHWASSALGVVWPPPQPIASGYNPPRFTDRRIGGSAALAGSQSSNKSPTYCRLVALCIPARSEINNRGRANTLRRN